MREKHSETRYINIKSKYRVYQRNYHNRLHTGYKTNVWSSTLCKIGSLEVLYTRCWKNHTLSHVLTDLVKYFMRWKMDTALTSDFQWRTGPPLLCRIDTFQDDDWLTTHNKQRYCRKWKYGSCLIKSAGSLPLFSVLAIRRVQRKEERIIRGHQHWISL